MNLSTFEEIQRLSAVLRSRQPSPLIQSTIHKLYQYECSEVRQQRAQVQLELEAFESASHMSSEQFFERYQRGEMSDEMDMFEWASLIKFRMTLDAQLAVLESASYE